MGKKYRNPPIVEALCEIHFQGSQWDAAIPGLFYEKIREEYPERRQLEQLGIEINFSPQVERITKRRGTPRIQFLTADKSRIIQIAPDLIVVNQLKPYPQFEDWEPVVEAVAAKYADLTSPSSIKQIGLRYINHIAIPKAPIKDFFQIYPHIPADLGASHGSFVMRVEINPLREGHLLLATFGYAKPPGPDATAFLLDIYDTLVPESPLDLKNLRGELLKAHDNVEAVFESSITDRLRGLFEEVKNGACDDGKS
ncbi:MAG: TIGR04255 family protein [Elusimicrobia bacterium]|nr:TIGR04255 family protein [Elusimicrobiota bacterium]